MQKKKTKTSERTKWQSAGNGKGKQVGYGIQGVKGACKGKLGNIYYTVGKMS